MKQVILLLAIHLLIFHQYQKDKKESSANAKKLTAKGRVPEQKKPISPYLAVASVDSLNDAILTTPSYEFQSHTFLRIK